MKHSIRIKLTIIFGIMITATVVSYIILNGVFLEKYYMGTKEDDLIDTYEYINKKLDNNEELTDDIKNSIYARCERKGITILIIDNYGTEQIRIGNGIILANRLTNIFFSRYDSYTTVIKSTSGYVLQKYDNREIEPSQYLEMYGFMDSGQRFIMRMTIQSIRESIDVFNKFFIIVSAFIMFISMLIMFFTARQFTKPILKLADISKKMTDLDFGVKYREKRNDEIGILGKSMNEMSEKLEYTISELKTANNELKKDIQKKNEIDEMRKEFLSNVSHELKTPIALISGYAEGLQECVNDDEESRDYYCDVIIDEASKMNKMVKQLLSLNRLEFGDSNTEIEHFDIKQVINGVLQSFNLMFEQKNIRIKTRLDGENMVWADEFQIEEVLTNYISNAVNHCSGDNTITIETKDTDNDKIRIEVFNTGECIPDDELDKVWIKFYKVDKARSREYGGSGIGLSIVKAIMEAHNQKYGVYNSEDGVVFWFELDAKLS